MASYNRVIMMGNLTRDPEYKQLASGQAVCRLGLASNRQFKNRQSGELVQEVCFVDIDVWGAQAESCQQYLQKGRAVLVEGRLKFDTWEDGDGGRRSKHTITADRVTFISSGQDDASQGDSTDGGGGGGYRAPEPQPQQAAPAKAPEPQQAAPAPAPAKQAAPAPAPAAPTGEVKLQDQKPFEDDLPF